MNDESGAKVALGLADQLKTKHEKLVAAQKEIRRLRALVIDTRRQSQQTAAELNRRIREMRREIAALTLGSSADVGSRGEDASSKPWSAQVSTHTFPHRNDQRIVRLAAALKEAGKERPRILSFGCSTGVEALDLLRLLPSAQVLGCDVDPYALAAARVTCEPLGIGIFVSSPESLKAFGPYDAIVAFNVLVRYPDIVDRESISDVYPFDNFDFMVEKLVECMHPGGILAVYNACYLVEQTSSAATLTNIQGAPGEMNGWIDKYDLYGRRLTRCWATVEGREVLTNEWRRLILGKEKPELRHAPYRHEPVAAAGVSPDLGTYLWRKM